MIVADTTPYPWPYDGDLSLRRLALVLCGHDARWAQECGDVEAVATRLDRVAARLLDRGVLVVRVRHHLDNKSTGSPPGRLAGDPRVSVATASGIDGFYGSDLDHRLRRAGCDQLALGGYGLETTVHSTMRSANDRGYECLLLEDASASSGDPQLAGAAGHMVEMSGGIFGAVGTTAALLAALDQPQEEAS